jgi:predicted acylesterase/phospholipase RssA
MPTTDQKENHEPRGEPAQQDRWLSIARDFIETEGYKIIEEGPLPGSLIVGETVTGPLRGGTCRWLLHAQANLTQDEVLPAEKLREALDQAKVSGLIAVYHYPDNAAYASVPEKVQEVARAISDRYRWRLVSTAEIESNVAMKDTLKGVYQERFAGKQTAQQRALQRVREDRRSFFLGLLILWVIIASVVKRVEIGQSVMASIFLSYGYLLLIVFLVTLIVGMFFTPLYMAAKKWGPYVVALILLPLMAWMGVGSYNPFRDILAALAAIMIVVFPLRPIFRKLKDFLIDKGLTRPRAEIWRRRAKAASWLLAVWIIASIGDIWLGTDWKPASPLTGDVVLFKDRLKFLEIDPRPPRLGLALSGGGYRAALMHAGVLAALEEKQVPVAGLSTVSGGSIIGGAYVHGVKPEAFKELVKRGGFNLKREIFNVTNLLRLPCPLRIPWLDIKMLWFCSYSRSDIQAALLDRRIFQKATMAGAPPALSEEPDWWLRAPWWLVGGTDLMSGDLIGIGAGGLFRRSHPTHGSMLGQGRLNRMTSAPRFEPLTEDVPLREERVSSIVAASGAFPGALSSMNWKLSANDQPCGSVSSPCIQVADGGLTDNLGFSLLMTAHQWGITTNQKEWQLDMILVSDGGMPLRREEDVSVYSDVFRAADVVYASSGIQVTDSEETGLNTLWLSPQKVSIKSFPGDLPASFVEFLKAQNVEVLEDAQQHLERCRKTFYATPTLQDQFKTPLTTRIKRSFSSIRSLFKDNDEYQRDSGPYRGEEAVEAIYALGQYLVYLNWAQLEEGWKKEGPG